MNRRIIALIVNIMLLGWQVSAQKKAPENWFNLDPKKDKVYGVSTERTYAELLKGKKSKTVVVAVIDGGTEVKHEDLKDVIWVNKNEIAGNNIDDDKNGYVDDVNGWNFIGGKDSNVVEDNLEMTRVYRKYRTRYEDIDPGTLQTAQEKEEYALFIQAKKAYSEKKENEQKTYEFMKQLYEDAQKIIKNVGKEFPTSADINAYPSTTKTENLAKFILIASVAGGSNSTEALESVKKIYSHYDKTMNYHLNVDFDPRFLVGDDYNNVQQRIYGNNRVSGPNGDHGTHVAGIIAAVRNNDLGMKGVADNVRIMVLRVVPDGDERDKDIANAIRYAVDNGAKIINMSFGKAFSPDKSEVDEAVRYAVSKDVLLVHAAGNDSKNIDREDNFPNDRYQFPVGYAESWIEVGASSWKRKKELTAQFSNYGKQNVDVFAPGVDINSCIPESKYASFNGTSMASPVTAGVAAVLRSYFPELTAAQVKELILASAIRYNKKVFKPSDEKSKEKVQLSDLCTTGGVVNLYEAVKLAIAKGYRMAD